MPITVNRSNFGAIYFVKGRLRIGALVRNLNDHERQLLQTNQGVVITTIVDGSPAFNADVLPGDMIISINGEKVSNEEVFARMSSAPRGQPIKLSLIRQGRAIEKSLAVGD
ncbi:PDZ domain-containing protein [Pseudomonas sp. SIMBA_077]